MSQQPVHSYCNLWKSWCQQPFGLRSHPKCSMQRNSHFLYLLWGWWCTVRLINSKPHHFGSKSQLLSRASRAIMISSGTGLCHTFYTYVSNISSYESHMNLKWNKLLLVLFPLARSPSWSKYQIPKIKIKNQFPRSRHFLRNKEIEFPKESDILFTEKFLWKIRFCR